MKNLCIAALLILFCFKINAAGTIVGTVPITGTSIGIFEKFEVGVQLSASYSNPYDPDVVSLQAVFTSPSGKQYPVNGFFYRDYATDDSKQACDDNPTTYSAHWKELTTNYNWRLRFAPNEIGAWTYAITLYEPANHNTVIYHNLHFDCSPSSNHGYLSVSGNKRFLEYTDRTSFFGIASNFSFYNGRNTLPTSVLPAASCSLVNGCTSGPQCAPLCSNPNGFRHTTVAQAMMTKWLNDFSAVGGNMARVWMTPTCGLGIEWERLNNYDNRQNRAWELDNLIDLCHTKGIYIHLVLDAPEELGCEYKYGFEWPDNPYHTITGVNTMKDFFDNAQARKVYEKKLRYIIARWGYATNIATYEIVNEIGWIPGKANVTGTDCNGLGYWYDASYQASIRSWLDEMSTYIKSNDYYHMVTVSGGPLSATDSYYSLPNIDITTSHSYGRDQNMDYQRSYEVTRELRMFDKPHIIGEMGFDQSCQSNNYAIVLHNMLWATAMSGTFSTGMDYAWDANTFSYCWGTDYKHYIPISNFFKGIITNDLLSTYEPISNYYGTYTSYAPATYGQNPPPDAPPIDQNGYTSPGWADGYGGCPNVPSTNYMTDGIVTYDQNGQQTRNLEAFALKKQQVVFGWVHNKSSYWYNYQNNPSGGTTSIQACSSGNPSVACTAIGNPNSGVNNVSSLSGYSMTITGLRCNGKYRVEWYNTDPYVSSGFNTSTDQITDAAVLATGSTTVTAVNGSATIYIPTLKMNTAGTAFGPDYGFKMFYIDNLSSNAYWVHAYTDFWYQNPNNDLASPTDIKEASNGDMFYRGSDGFMHHFYWDQNTAKWTHDGLVANYNLQNTNYKMSVDNPLFALNGNNMVIYKGADGRLQHYTKNSGSWVHDYTDLWFQNSNYNVRSSSDIKVSANGEIFYIGVDGFIQHFYWNPTTSQWTHDGLVANYNSQSANFKAATDNAFLALNGNNMIIYKGADGRLQHYTKNSGSWVHDYTDLWFQNISYNVGANTEITVSGNGEIFYRGADGYLQHFYWNQTTSQWTHDGLVANYNTQDPNFKIAPDDPFMAMNGNDMIVYKGADGRLQHYTRNSGSWVHDYTDLWFQNPSYYVAKGSDIVIAGNGDIFYQGTDGFIQHFYWNQSTSQWTHDGLVTNYTTQDPNFKFSPENPFLALNGNYMVIYKGVDGRLQHYNVDNPCYQVSGKTDDESLYNQENFEDSVNNHNEEFIIYPNPSNKSCTIQFYANDANDRIEFSLMDITGNEIKRISTANLSKGVNQVDLATDGLASGVYLIRSSVNNVPQLKRFSVVH